jgi:hypothetical protein
VTGRVQMRGGRPRGVVARELAQLEAELGRVEDRCFDGDRPNGAPPEVWDRRAELVAAITQIECELDPEADEARRLNGVTRTPTCRKLAHKRSKWGGR